MPRKTQTHLSDETRGMGEWSFTWEKPSQDSKIIEIVTRLFKSTEVRFDGRPYKPPCQKEEFKKQKVM